MNVHGRAPRYRSGTVALMPHNSTRAVARGLVTEKGRGLLARGLVATIYDRRF